MTDKQQIEIQFCSKLLAEYGEIEYAIAHRIVSHAIYEDKEALWRFGFWPSEIDGENGTDERINSVIKNLYKLF